MIQTRTTRGRGAFAPLPTLAGGGGHVWLFSATPQCYKRANRWSKPMRGQERIEINAKVLLGKPVIRGTRISVELILRKLGEGASERELLESYPHLTKEDIRAAMTYAADSLAHEDMVIAEPKE
jgi:uncharacterized protein (DUF433 family)